MEFIKSLLTIENLTLLLLVSVAVWVGVVRTNSTTTVKYKIILGMASAIEVVLVIVGGVFITSQQGIMVIGFSMLLLAGVILKLIAPLIAAEVSKHRGALAYYIITSVWYALMIVGIVIVWSFAWFGSTNAINGQLTEAKIASYPVVSRKTELESVTSQLNEYASIPTDITSIKNNYNSALQAWEAQYNAMLSQLLTYADAGCNPKAAPGGGRYITKAREACDALRQHESAKPRVPSEVAAWNAKKGLEMRKGTLESEIGELIESGNVANESDFAYLGIIKDVFGYTSDTDAIKALNGILFFIFDFIGIICAIVIAQMKKRTSRQQIENDARIAANNVRSAYHSDINDAIPSYDKGGYIPRDEVAQIHGGEYILTKEEVDKLGGVSGVELLINKSVKPQRKRSKAPKGKFAKGADLFNNKLSQ